MGSGMTCTWMAAGWLLLIAPVVVLADCARAYTASNSAELGYAAFLDENGAPAGFSADFYRELARRTGCTITFSLLPPLRQNAMAERSMQALLVPVVARSRRAHLFVPLLAMPLDLIVRKALGVQSPTHARANPNVVFGRVPALSYGKWGDAFLDALPKRQLDDTPTIEALFRKLAVGRVGATFGYSLAYQRNLDINQLNDQVSVIPVKEAGRTVMGMTIAYKQVAPADVVTLSNAAVAMRHDGTLARLLARYLPPNVAADIVWRAHRDPVPH